MNIELTMASWLGFSYLVDTKNGVVYDINGNVLPTYSYPSTKRAEIQIEVNGVKRLVAKHRLVYNAFKQICGTNIEIRFINGNYNDCRLSNLKEMTHKESMLLREENGNGRGRRVKCYTVDGKFVGEYKSAVEAANELGLDRAAISRSANDEYGKRSTKGYKFTFID